MSTAVAHGLLPLGPILVIVVFFVLYDRVIWPRTTREPWTYIVRRNDWLSVPIIVVALAALGVTTWQAPWWLAWLPVFLVFVIAFWAHIDWGGIRAGEIHKPTAWRCAEELRAHSPAAADWLEQQLGQAGHPYARSDRTGQRRGL
jgi:hypothetical protein